MLDFFVIACGGGSDPPLPPSEIYHDFNLNNFVVPAAIVLPLLILDVKFRWIVESQMIATGGFILMFFVGGFFALPYLCGNGEIVGDFKLIFLGLVLCRLVWHIYKRNLRYTDYAIYFVLVIWFGLYLNSLDYM